MRKLNLLLALLFAGDAFAQNSFVLPKDRGNTPPVFYLEKIEIKDVSRQLNEKERHEICRLFLGVEIVTVRKYPELDTLSPKAPIYQLFKANFPAIGAREEAERGISLRSIVGFINSMTEYRIDVDRVLRESLNRKTRCKP